LLSRCLGYYDGFKTVLFSDISALGGSPEVTEMHEFIHKELSQSSVVGNIHRYFALVTELEGANLPRSVVEQLQLLATEICSTSFVPQEAIAVYLSLFPYSDDTGLVSSEVERLPKQYRDLYELSVATFGPLEVTGTLAPDIIEIIMAIGIAALSPPVDPLPMPRVVRFDDLSDFLRFVRLNSANQRFAAILRHLEPLPLPGLLSDAAALGQKMERGKVRDISANQDFSTLQKFIWRRIEEICPEIKIAKHRPSLRAWGRALFESILVASQKLGATSLERVVLEPISQANQGAASQLDAKITHRFDPGGELPYDSSFGHKFRPVEPGWLLKLSQLNEVAEIHAFVQPVAGEEVPDSRPLLGLFCVVGIRGRSWQRPQKGEVPLTPFAAVGTESDLCEILVQMRPSLLAARTTESVYPDVKSLFVKSRLTAYVILERREPKYLCELAAKYPGSLVLFVTFTTSRFVCLLTPDKAEVFVAPATLNTLLILQHEIEARAVARIISDPKEAEKHGVDVAILSSILSVIQGDQPGRP